MYYWAKEVTIDYKGNSLVEADNEAEAKAIFKLQMLDPANDIIINKAKACPVCNKIMPFNRSCDNCKNY